MSEAIHIEAATTGDVAAIETLVNSAYRGESSRMGWTTEADLLDGIRIDKEGLCQLLSQSGTTLLKAATGSNELVGVVQLEQQHHSMYLGMLTVKPTRQNLGIGKLLLAAGEQLAIEKGCTKVVMTVISVRHELIEWYQSKGYRTTGERKPFPSDPRFGIPKQNLEFIVLEKTLQA